jgi:hypothetical protein
LPLIIGVATVLHARTGKLWTLVAAVATLALWTAVGIYGLAAGGLFLLPSAALGIGAVLCGWLQQGARRLN